MAAAPPHDQPDWKPPADPGSGRTAGAPAVSGDAGFPWSMFGKPRAAGAPLVIEHDGVLIELTTQAPTHLPLPEPRSPQRAPLVRREPARRFEAAVFDLDGVLTDTAHAHFADGEQRLAGAGQLHGQGPPTRHQPLAVGQRPVTRYPSPSISPTPNGPAEPARKMSGPLA